MIRPRADRDVDEIADYLFEQANFNTALRFLEELHRTLALIAANPEMGRLCKVPHPKLAMARVFRVSARFAAYLIFYRPVSEGIDVLRVLHGSRELKTALNDGAVD